MSHDIWQIIDLIVRWSATTHDQREGAVVGLLPAALRGGGRAGGRGCPSVTLPPSLANATSARHGESERRRREAEERREGGREGGRRRRTMK